MFQFPSCPSRNRDDRSLHRPGCPIRRSVDQCALAAPYRVSSLGTSFLGTSPQGIHQTPCVALEPHSSLRITSQLRPPHPPKRAPRHRDPRAPNAGHPPTATRAIPLRPDAQTDPGTPHPEAEAAHYTRNAFETATCLKTHIHPLLYFIRYSVVKVLRTRFRFVRLVAMTGVGYIAMFAILRVSDRFHRLRSTQ